MNGLIQIVINKGRLMLNFALLSTTTIDYIYSLFTMLGGIAIFMYGMKIMSDNIERLAGDKMQRMMGKVSENNIIGVGIGFGVTAIIQSSTAVTVMLVGFVNVGIISLMQATAIILGSNIGTTITMQIISLEGIKWLDMTAFAAIIAFVGFLLIMTNKKDALTRLGRILLGFGMIFIGLDMLSSASLIFEQPLGKFFTVFNNPILLVLFGTVFTGLVQSSAASTILIGEFVGLGAISFDAAMYVIMGMNIGTCFTAMISSVGTSVNAKRTAWIHLLVNVIPTVVMFILFYFIKDISREFIYSISMNTAMHQIANFHLLFNIFSALMLLPFIRPLGKLAKLIVPDKDEKVSDSFKLKFLDERVLKTPPFAVAQALKEVNRMAAVAKQNLDEAMKALLSKEYSLEANVKKREEEINYLNKAITRYLVQISNLDISYQDEKIIGSLFNVVTDIERIGDHADNIMKYALKMRDHNILFSEDANFDLISVADILNKLYDSTMLVFNKRQLSAMDDVNMYEEQTDKFKRNMTNAHVERLNNGECTAECGAIYLSLASNLERVADHFTNIAESVLTYVKQPSNKVIVKAVK